LELYKELVTARESLKNRYEDAQNAEAKAMEIQTKVQSFVSQDDDLTSSTGKKVDDARKAVVRDFEKFFNEKLDPTVPPPFYGILSRDFMYAKIFIQQNNLNHATKEAITHFLFFAHVETVINLLRDFDFQTWLFELNVSEEDDFNNWLANLLVEVSQEVQDKRFNRVASYLIDVLHTEALREEEAKGNGLPLWHFFVSQSQDGKTSKLDFTTRYFELDGRRYSGAMISEIQFGTESHTKHSGFVSNEHMYTTITLFLEDGSQYTRYQFMGNTEQEINTSRISNQRGMETLASIYEVTNGGHGFSSSGYRTSYSIGYWF
jgi:hypothetical protein